MEAGHFSEMVQLERPYARGYYCFKPSQLNNYARDVKERRFIVTEPPVTKELSDEEIGAFKDIPFKTAFTCHSQACERGVKATSTHTKKLTKYRDQLGEALLAEHHKRIMPTDITQKGTFLFEDNANATPDINIGLK